MWAQNVNETSGKNSMVNDIFNAAGVRNVCNLPNEHVSVNIEKLIDWDPKTIIMWSNDKLDPKDILADPLLKNLTAVKTKNVYELNSIFENDFWTLKFLIPVYKISIWASKQTNALDSEISTNSIFTFLYGRNFIE